MPQRAFLLCSLQGAFGVNGIEADIVTFGKVIGGGLPAAAFGARAEIMDLLSPTGAVYQAGTLSGNPLAMAAGIASLKKAKTDKALYARLGELAGALMAGFKDAANAAGVALQVCSVGSMFGFFFNENEVQNYQDALRSDTAAFARFHKAMLKRGVYLACSQFETGFVCDKMDKKIIARAVDAAYESFRSL